MQETLTNFYEATSAIDLFYIVITLFSLIKCYKNGFVYHDAISGKYFRRDSSAPGGDGVPQGFVEIQINR